MKLNKILGAVLAAGVLAGCTTEDDIFKNQVFISADNFREEVRVAIDENVDEMSSQLTIAVAKPCSEDLVGSFDVASDLLEHYREAYYDPNVDLLPESNYSLGEAQAVIKAGDVKSFALNVDFKNLRKLDFSKNYVLPLKMTCEGLPVLENASTIYYVVKPASLVNTVADMKSNMAWPEWGNFEEVGALEQLTMEALINAHTFNNASKVHTIMGIEDHFLIRIGDKLKPKNQIEIAAAYNDGKTLHRKSVSTSAMQLKTDRWYHLAVTFNKGVVDVYIDGVLKAHSDALCKLGETTNEETGMKEPIIFDKVNFKVKHSDETDGDARSFWVGYSCGPDRSFDGMIAEARVWNRVLSKEEINEETHPYKLYDPASDESLLAYWKFNEGKGKSVKDHSRYGHDLTADHDFVWYPVSLPVEK